MADYNTCSECGRRFKDGGFSVSGHGYFCCRGCWDRYKERHKKELELERKTKFTAGIFLIAIILFASVGYMIAYFLNVPDNTKVYYYVGGALFGLILSIVFRKSKVFKVLLIGVPIVLAIVVVLLHNSGSMLFGISW